MDTSDLPQRPADRAGAPQPAPDPLPDSLTPAAPEGAYPPPPDVPPYFPPTETMSAVAAPDISRPIRMERPQALDLLSRLKATIVAVSVISFGVFAALAAAHVTGVTSRSNSSTRSTTGTQTSPAATPSDQSNFFNQSPYGVGAPGSQPPVSSTSVS